MQAMNLENTYPKITDSKGIQELLGISEATLIRAKKRGEIPFMTVCGSHRYCVDKVIKALEERSNNRGGRRA